jgi:thiosulfate/3-mercaptopyruvate sulfurtransferase
MNTSHRITLASALHLCLAAAILPAQDHGHGPGHGAAARVRHNPHYLVTTDWVGARLDSAGMVVLHVGRSDSMYRAGHIPGALFLPLSAVATTVGGVPNQFPSAEPLAATFRNLGVGETARIVIYGDDPGILASRAWVALDLLGHSERAALLDGGLARWRAEGRPVETGARPPASRPFTARRQENRLVDAAWIRERLGDTTVLLLDTRPADQFAGAEPAGPNAIPEGRRGRIPGSRNLFWMTQLASAADPILKPMQVLHHELWEPAGADRARTIVTYCRSGMQASHAYFVARYIGYPDVRLYDGSFIEWAALPAADYPVETESRRR